MKPLASPSEGAKEGWSDPLEGVKQAILTLIELDFCFYDFESEFVFVKEMARWQIGESLKEKDNRVVGLRKYVKSMPKPIAARFLERYNEDFHLGFSLEEYYQWAKGKPSSIEAPLKPLVRGSMEPLRSQEQDQEQYLLNTNKQQTEVCNEEPASEEEVCSEDFPDSIADQAENLAIDETLKVVDDPDAIVTPVQVIGIARMLGVKVCRSEKLNQVCSQKILTVDNIRQCVRIAKKEQKGGRYLVGILANAVNEPSQYHTWEYLDQKHKEDEAGIDWDKPF